MWELVNTEKVKGNKQTNKPQTNKKEKQEMW